MPVINRADFDCKICTCSIAPHEQRNPIIWIENCNEYMHKQCLEGTLVFQFQNYVLNFASTQNSISEFKTPNRKKFTLDQVVYSRNIDEIWNKLGNDEEINHSALLDDAVEPSQQAHKRKVYGNESWGLLRWGSFTLRLIYHVAIAFFVETGIEILEGEATYKKFRRANVSDRLTPLFNEYHRFEYNPKLKKTFETKAWNWIGEQIRGR